MPVIGLANPRALGDGVEAGASHRVPGLGRTGKCGKPSAATAPGLILLQRPPRWPQEKRKQSLPQSPDVLRRAGWQAGLWVRGGGVVALDPR